ncbi:MAG TPA: porin family protein [Puia sp.]|nr:porin family protein [Puia sp.]
MTKNSTQAILGLCFFLLFSLSAEAQWDLGLQGGISIPNLSASGSENNPLNTGYSSRLGPEFAIFGEYYVNSLFSLVPKIEYSAQGGKKDGFQAMPTPTELAQYFEQQGMPVPTYLYANFNSEAKLDYLLIPILAKFGWYLDTQKKFRITIAAGPYLGFLLSAKQVTSGNSYIYLDPAAKDTLPVGSQSFDQTTDIKNQLNTTNFGVDGSVGIEYLFGSSQHEKIFFEAGGNYGFLNIQKGTANGKNNTGAATVMLGYAYKLGK